MKGIFLLFAVATSLFLGRPAIAEVTLDLWGNPQDSDLGNITSDGSGGRQIQVRPMEAEDVGHDWKFFPPSQYFPELYPDSPPATPAQNSIFLTAGTPLLLVLPQLAHFPMGASVSVSHSINGQQIEVDASLDYLGYATDTIYGPHEYLHPFGPLEAGQYRLNLILAQTWFSGSANISTTTGYVDFVVHGIPEPSSLILICTSGFIVGLIICRRAR